MAAPAVAGTVALLFETAGRKLTAEETRLAVLSGCEPPAPNADPDRLGNGYLNPAAVLAAHRADGESVTFPGNVRVAVVGGGFGGLAAAWHLRRAGFSVTVFEASGRLGGRVRSNSGLVPGKVVEAGAELIGENHPNWRRFAEIFGLTLEEIDRARPTRVRLGDVDVSQDDVREAERELDRVRRLIAAEAATVPPLEPWAAPGAARLDAMSVAARIGEPDMFGSRSSLARRLFEVVTENDQCAPLAAQSYLGLLSAVRAHTHAGDPLGYWRNTETHRCKGGNEQLATHLAKAMPDVRLNTPVTFVRVRADGVHVGFITGGAAAAERFTYAVLAAPPPLWPWIDAEPAFRPADFIMRHGPAVKFIGAFDTDHWGSPDVLWDRLGTVWASTARQQTPNAGFGLSTYSGGRFVLDPARYIGRLEQIFPGYRRRLKAQLYANWPAEPWVRTGYSVPAPGQVTTIARNLSRPFRNRLFFAGEQASPGFFGYMEGALQSGALAASRITVAVAVAYLTETVPTEEESTMRGPVRPGSVTEHVTGEQVSAARLFDVFAAPGRVPATLAAAFEVVAAPGGGRSPVPASGDLVLSRGRGSPFAAVAVVGSPALREQAGLAPAGYVAESRLRGRYVHVDAPVPHRVARRITDPAGVLLDHILILRRRPVPAALLIPTEGPAESPAESPDESPDEGPDERRAWSGTDEQTHFREVVLAAHLERQAKRRGAAGRDLTDAELAPVPGTSVRMRGDAAVAAGRLLAAANSALAAAQVSGDQDAARTVRVTAASGYRNRSHQETLWRKYFAGYYDETRAARESLPDGPHGAAAVHYLLETFRIPARVAAPGYSNHQNGIAIDLAQERAPGHRVRNSTSAAAVQAWRRTWLSGWLREHAATFGFQPYQREPWHWDYRPGDTR
jgi:monoamine oxidase